MGCSGPMAGTPHICAGIRLTPSRDNMPQKGNALQERCQQTVRMRSACNTAHSFVVVASLVSAQAGLECGSFKHMCAPRRCQSSVNDRAADRGGRGLSLHANIKDAARKYDRVNTRPRYPQTTRVRKKQNPPNCRGTISGEQTARVTTLLCQWYDAGAGAKCRVAHPAAASVAQCTTIPSILSLLQCPSKDVASFNHVDLFRV